MGGDGGGNPLTSPLTAHSALLDLGLSALVRADELRRLPRLKGHAVSMFISRSLLMGRNPVPYTWNSMNQLIRKLTSLRRYPRFL